MKRKLNVTQSQYNMIPKKGFFRQIEIVVIALAIIFVWAAKDDAANYNWYCIHALVAAAAVLLIDAVGVIYTRVQYNKRRIKRSDVLNPLL